MTRLLGPRREKFASTAVTLFYNLFLGGNLEVVEFAGKLIVAEAIIELQILVNIAG